MVAEDLAKIVENQDGGEFHSFELLQKNRSTSALPPAFGQSQRKSFYAEPHGILKQNQDEQSDEDDSQIDFYEESKDQHDYDEEMIGQLFDQEVVKLNKKTKTNYLTLKFSQSLVPVAKKEISPAVAYIPSTVSLPNQKHTELSEKYDARIGTGNGGETRVSTNETLRDQESFNQSDETEEWDSQPPTFNMKRRNGILSTEEQVAMMQ